MMNAGKFISDHPTPVDCQIKGSIPSWVEGTLYRNGPALYNIGKDKMKHLFDGMAVIHGYNIKNGCVRYHNRLLDSDTYARNTAANRVVFGEFGTVAAPDPCKSIFSRYATYFFGQEMTDNTSVNLMLVEDQIMAMTETPKLNFVDKETLKRVDKSAWDKYVAVHTATAHPFKDFDGTIYNLGMTLGGPCCYKIIRTRPSKSDDPDPMSQTELLASIPSVWKMNPSYMHSFAITDNYLILLEQSLRINMFTMATLGIRMKAFMEVLQFHNDCKAKFHVVEKSTGKVLSTNYESAPIFVFHHVNAYEEDGHIVLDVAGYDDGEIIQAGLMDYVEQIDWSTPHTTFRRFALPLDTDKDSPLVTLDYTSATATKQEDKSVFCEPEILKEIAIELPRVNETRQGKKYRYTYGISEVNHGCAKLAKVDLEAKTQTFWFDEKAFPCEPVFVPRPGATEEDDGVVVSPCVALKEEDPSFLIVLDASSFTELGRAEIPSNIRIPYSFHGIFIDK